MNGLKYLIVLACLLGVSTSNAQTFKVKTQEKVKAFINVNVLTMEDSIPKMSQTVLIKNGKIIKIGTSKNVPIPDHAKIIDGEHKKFLIPGLTDAHVHLHHSGAKEWIRAFINSGVTTVFNLGGRPKILKLREDIENLKIVGPDIYTTGISGVVKKLKSKGFRKVSLDKIEKRLLEDKKKGYDMIKIYGQMTIEQYEHIMKVAKREGVHATGHIPRNLSADDALRVGQKSFAHTEEFIYTQFQKLDEKEVIDFAKKAAEHKIWLIPNIVAYKKIEQTWGKPHVMDSIVRLPETKRLHPKIIDLYKRDWYGSKDFESRWYIEKVFKFHTPIVKYFHKAGVKILTGTDTAFPLAPPGESLIEEIDNLVKIGLSPYEALKAATSNPGEYIKLFIDKGSNFGKIKEGYTANLILLESNPLKNLNVLKTPEGVLLRGHWFNTEDLKEMIKWD
jgi:imidazolonepropionase-like amidohydrolase